MMLAIFTTSFAVFIMLLLAFSVWHENRQRRKSDRAE